MRLAPLLLLCACSLPDEVGVGVHGSAYDFLGGDGAAPWFETDRGNDIGVNAWASWKLRPQRVELVQSEKPWQPTTPHDPTVIVNTPAAVKQDNAIDSAVKVGAAIDAMDVSTKWLIASVVLALLIAAIALRRYLILFIRWFFPKRTP